MVNIPGLSRGPGSAFPGFAPDPHTLPAVPTNVGQTETSLTSSTTLSTSTIGTSVWSTPSPSSTLLSTTSRIISTFSTQVPSSSSITSATSATTPTTIPATTSAAVLPSSSSISSCDSRCIIIASTVSVSVGLLLLAGLMFFLVKRRRRNAIFIIDKREFEHPSEKNPSTPPRISLLPATPSTLGRVSTFFAQAMGGESKSERSSRTQSKIIPEDGVSSGYGSRDPSPLGRPSDVDRPSRGMNWSSR